MPDLGLWASDAYLETHAAGAFRPIRLRKQRMHGADVYALQSALHAYHDEIDRDGIFGPQSKKITEQVQAKLGLEVDGVAGGVTQGSIARSLAKTIGPVYGLPQGIPLGHVQQESSGILGQYTTLYTVGDAKDSRDEGVVQMNTRFYAVEVAFDPPEAIEVLCKKIRSFFLKYQPLVGDKRAWQLACGAWNAPATTDALSKGQGVRDAERDRIENYISRVTAFAPSLD